MSEDKKSGIVSLQKIFEDLEQVEEIIQRNPDKLDSDEVKRGTSILKEVKKELSPLAEERNAVDLELIMEDINLAIDVLSDRGDASKILSALESTKINLTKYNLRGRKDT